MNNITSIHSFKTNFLSRFIFTPELLPFSDKEIAGLDKELDRYETVFLNPEIAVNLISRNELLVSFAISKAENSRLTLTEAKDVYGAEKLKPGKKLTKKDYERLEFFNIAKTFRQVSRQKFKIDDLNPDFVKKVHLDLTRDLDKFKDCLSDFTAYKSGKWRDNDRIRVGSYIPAPHDEIPEGVDELITWFKANRTITGAAVFHTAFYALHPFNNGNKRVSRILEHLFLRSLGVNRKNLYSPSYYYHLEKERYYKYLLYSLERANLNYFSAFILEALVLAMIGAVESSLNLKRADFIKKRFKDKEIRSILKPLCRQTWAQFKIIERQSRRNRARQTLVNYLARAVITGAVLKKTMGKKTFYSLNLVAPETETITNWLKFASERLDYIPDKFRLV